MTNREAQHYAAKLKQTIENKTYVCLYNEDVTHQFLDTCIAVLRKAADEDVQGMANAFADLFKVGGAK